MKKLLTILLLFIITMQILPMAELGKFISDKEFVENDFCEEIEIEKKFETDAFYTIEFNPVILKKKKVQNHFPIAASGLQPHPICVVTTPPPNMA
jgi:hypothetical protein